MGTSQVLFSSMVLIAGFVCYRLMIQRYVSFKIRRLVLLFIGAIALSLPFVSLERIFPDHINDLIQPIADNFLGDFYELEGDIIASSDLIESRWSWFYLLSIVYILGIVVRLLQLIFQFIPFYRRIYTNKKLPYGKCYCVIIDEPHQAYTFGKYIVISRAIWESQDAHLIIKHEQMHARFGHSIDRLFTEFLCIFQWFNPFIYWFRKDLIAVHEYQVDKAVVDSGINTIMYQQLIANYTSPAYRYALGNYFNQSLSLNRIKMMAQDKSFGRWSSARTLILLPIFLMLLGFYSFRYETLVINNDDPFILPIAQDQLHKTVKYGMQMHPETKQEKLHTGVDFVAPLGTDILAVQDARVIRVEYQATKGYGNNVVLAIDGTTSVLYGHMNTIHVKANDVVKQGDVIGTVGNTGLSTKPHLHFEVIANGEKIDPVDFLPAF